jgi:hypothetical protein
VLGRDLPQGAPGEGAVQDGRGVTLYVTDLPCLGDRPVGQADAARPLGNGPAAEDVLL